MNQIIVPRASVTPIERPDRTISDVLRERNGRLVDAIRDSPGLAEAMRRMVLAAEQFAIRKGCRPQDVSVDLDNIRVSSEHVFHMQFVAP